MEINDIVQLYANSTIEQIGNLTPHQIGSHLIIMSAKLWSVGSEILKAEQATAQKWLELRQSQKTDTSTDKIIKTTAEWSELTKLKWIEKTIVELLRSLKRYLKSKEFEAQNQF